MNLVQLKYFHAVCTYQTVSAAAEFLYISQPTLSNAIKELEKEFGVTLFYRHHRGMVLTKEGEELFKLSRELLSRAEHIEHVMNDLGSVRKVLRLGVPPMIGSLVLPYIYRDFLAKNPEVRLEITEGGRKELLSKLTEDFLDIVFLPHNRPLDSALSALRIAELEIVFCTSSNNPLSRCKSVTAKDLENVPLVLFKNSFFQTEEIKKWFADSDIKPNILLQTEQLSTVLSLISKNIASGFLFKQLIRENSGLAAIPANASIETEVSLVWKKDAYFFDSMNRFLEYIKKENPLKQIK